MAQTFWMSKLCFAALLSISSPVLVPGHFKSDEILDSWIIQAQKKHLTQDYSVLSTHNRLLDTFLPVDCCKNKTKHIVFSFLKLNLLTQNLCCCALDHCPVTLPNFRKLWLSDRWSHIWLQNALVWRGVHSVTIISPLPLCLTVGMRYLY